LHRMSWHSQHQPVSRETRRWEPEFETESSPAPTPPSHSPRPSFVELTSEWEEIPPPPPSHSPRPVEIQDPWAAQAQAWRARRESAGEALKNNFQMPTHQSRHILEHESLYPAIPPRQEEIGWQPQSDREWEYAQSFSHELFQQPSRPLPTPSPQPRNLPPRPHSRNSAISFASSLAEELHPDKGVRPQPAPVFGRYTGGMDYGYERGAGFSGSAGTRSASGKADGKWKNIQFRASTGIDLGDVPIMGVMHRV